MEKTSCETVNEYRAEINGGGFGKLCNTDHTDHTVSVVHSPKPKTSAQRVREYRARKRAAAQAAIAGSMKPESNNGLEKLGSDSELANPVEELAEAGTSNRAVCTIPVKTTGESVREYRARKKALRTMDPNVFQNEETTQQIANVPLAVSINSYINKDKDSRTYDEAEDDIVLHRPVQVILKEDPLDVEKMCSEHGRRTKTAAQCARDYRARKKLYGTNYRAIFCTTPAKTAVERMREYRARKKAQRAQQTIDCDLFQNEETKSSVPFGVSIMSYRNHSEEERIYDKQCPVQRNITSSVNPEMDRRELEKSASDLLSPLELLTMRAKPKTAAQRAREYRARKRAAEQIAIAAVANHEAGTRCHPVSHKTLAKSAKERAREYRARKKAQKAQEIMDHNVFQNEETGALLVTDTKCSGGELIHKSEAATTITGSGNPEMNHERSEGPSSSDFKNSLIQLRRAMAAQRSREYRARKKLCGTNLRTVSRGNPPKTVAERVREYRARKKALQTMNRNVFLNKETELLNHHVPLTVPITTNTNYSENEDIYEEESVNRRHREDSVGKEVGAVVMPVEDVIVSGENLAESANAVDADPLSGT